MGADIENVLLLTVDSLRYDHVHREERSFLNADAPDFTSFERAFATGPGTTPSFPALLTGTLPLSYDGLGPLTDERPRLADAVRSAGVNTAGFQCNPFLSEHFNYHVGFETFEDYQNPLMGIATKVFPRGIEINNPRLERVDEVLHLTDALKKSYQLVKGKPRPYVSADVITDDTVEWLETCDEPFFCWTHYMDVHHPCFPPEPYRERWGVDDVTQSDVSEWYSAVLDDPETLSERERSALRDLYEASIDYVDDQIGRIVETLREQGTLESTCVIVTSDHGELFGDYDQFGKPERMYDELLRVPLLVKNGPDYLDDATDQLVSLLDVPPLVHDVLSVETPEAYEGRLPGVDPPRSVIIGEHEVEGDVVVGARSSDWLYERDEINDETSLFACRGDELSLVSPDHPDADLVQEAVKQRLSELDVETRILADEVEGDIQDRLADLGYL